MNIPGKIKNLKVLHVGASVDGGAGLGMLRLHESLLEQGIDSKILVADPCNMAKEKIYGMAPRCFADRMKWCFRVRLGDLHRYKMPLRRFKKEIGFFTLPFSSRNILREPLVQDADIINLHWVAGMLDYRSFFYNCKKPIVWTIRDENPFLGIFHYRRSMNSNVVEEVKKIDDEIRNIKVDAITHADNLSFVHLSEGMKKWGESFPWARKYRHVVIPNTIDGKKFDRFDTMQVRKEFNLPMDKTLLVFVSQSIEDPRKGFRELIEAVKMLNTHGRFHIVAVGEQGNNVVHEEKFITFLGKINDTETLAKLYSASDIFVNPSFEESFGKTMTEALACGTPVVSFPNLGALDIVSDWCGIITRDFTVSSLIDAIENASQIKWDNLKIREYVLSRFSPQIVAQNYIDLYNDVV